MQSNFKLQFVWVCGHVASPRKRGLDGVSSWPLVYCSKCPKYPQVFIFLESSNQSNCLPHVFLLKVSDFFVKNMNKNT